MTFGYSRDDVGKFLPIYISQGILQNDPFEVSVIFQMYPLSLFLEEKLVLQVNWMCICFVAGA